MGSTIAAIRTEELVVRRTVATLTRACATALTALVVGLALLLVLPAAPAGATVAPVPSVRVTTSAAATGSLAAAKAGQVVDIRLTGFGAATQVLVSIGPAALPRLVTTDAHGAAAVAAIVPRLPTDDYLVTAASRAVTASVPLHVVMSGKGKATTIQWIAPASTTSVARTASSLAAARVTAAAAKHLVSVAAAGARPSATASSVPPSIAAADRTDAAIPVTSLAALPASATSTPVAAFLGLGALLALAVGGSFAAVAWGLRRDAEVEPLGRHAPSHAGAAFVGMDELKAAAATALDRARTTVARATATGVQGASVMAEQVRGAAAQLSDLMAERRQTRASDDETEPSGRHGRRVD